MIIPLMINEAIFKSKDECIKWTAAIKNNQSKGYKSQVKHMNEDELADAIRQGHTIVPAILDEERELHGKHFKYQQLFGLDFDNKNVNNKEERADEDYYLDQSRIEAICKQYGITPIIIYETFSSTEAWKRYRVLFVTDEAISDKVHRIEFIKALMKLFAINGVITADTSCVDEGRIFYAGSEIVAVNSDATINPNAVIEAAKGISIIEVRREGPKSKERQSPKQACNEMVEAIMNKDLLTYRKLLSDAVIEAAKADGSWDETMSDKNQTITLKYLLKDYSLDIGESGLKALESTACNDIYELTSLLPMDLMLGLPFHKSFSCILPNHDDEHPSASINMLDTGDYVYNCWGCIDAGDYMDIIDVFSMLMGLSVGEAIRFIQDAIGLETETTWQKQQRDILSSNLDYMKSDYFKKHYSKLYTTLVQANAFGQLIFFLRFAQEHVTPYSLTRNKRLAFFLSIGKASELMREHSYKGTCKETIGRKLNYLCLLGLLEKVPEHDIPEHILSTAIMTSKQKSAKYKTEYKYRLDFLYVPQYTAQLLKDVQAVIIQNESLGVRRACLSREQIIRTYGKEAADNIYTQDVNKESSKKVEKFFNKYCAITRDLIEKQGFASEAEVLRQMNGYSKQDKKKLSGQCLPQLLMENNYKRITVNRQVRADYHIPSQYASGSKVIVNGNR